MNAEKITVRATATGQTLDVVVFSKRIDGIEVVLGEGYIACDADLSPLATEWPMLETPWGGKLFMNARATR